MDCTRCHNHKYDQLTAKDYYSISAFFDKIKERGRVGGKPLASEPVVNMPLYDGEEVKRMEQELHASLKAPMSAGDEAKYKTWYDEFYAQKSSLKKHIEICKFNDLTHLPVERPFACSYCPKRFSQKSNCTTHMKKIHLSKQLLNLQQTQAVESDHQQIVVKNEGGGHPEQTDEFQEQSE